jgi:glucans biosynthesis protein
MHGGAAGSGAPKGNTNALKHGGYTRTALAERRQFSELLQRAHALLRKIK